MKIRSALSLVAAALVTACAGVPAWDTNVFPQQPVYSSADVNPAAAQVQAEQHSVQSFGK